MRPMPAVRAVALTVVMAAIAGCSAIQGGVDPPETTTGIRDRVAPIYRELAQCIRQHGYPDFPDPVIKDDGTVDLPESVQRRIDQLSARLRPACEPIFNRLPASVREGRSEEPTATPEDVAKLRQFAQCMRKNGYPDWPDPKLDGTFPAAGGFGEGLRREGKSARFVAAMRTCRPPGSGGKWGIRISE